MPERDSHQLQVKMLLAQDQEINQSQMKEFRMQLEHTLESWEQKSKRTRRRILIVGGAWLVGLAILRVLMVLWSEAAADHASATLRALVYLPFLVATMATALAGIWLVALYVFRYSPRLNRARFDLQYSMLLELQQQVKQLRESTVRPD